MMGSPESFEDLLQGLTADELDELSWDIEPLSPSDIAAPPASYARRSQEKYDIKSMISVMEKKSLDSVQGDNYLPLKYREWTKQGKPREGLARIEREPRREQLPEEIESLFQDIDEGDMNEIAAVLGLHSLITQEQSFAAESHKIGEAVKKYGLKKPGIVQGKSPKCKPEALETPGTVQIYEIVQRLRDGDPTLTEIAMNNSKDIDDTLVELAELLKTNTSVCKLLVANTQMKPAICMHFVETMKENKTLKVVNMESNYLTGDVIAKLMSVLETNKVLEELKLANQACTGGFKAEQAIAKSLDANHKLKRFGYFFETRGPMMMAAKALLRNNDKVRQKRKSVHELYKEDM